MKLSQRRRHDSLRTHRGRSAIERVDAGVRFWTTQGLSERASCRAQAKSGGLHVWSEQPLDPVGSKVLDASHAESRGR